MVISLALIAVVTGACSSGSFETYDTKEEPTVVQTKPSEQPENSVEADVSGIEFKPMTIETSAYSISVPDDWKVEKTNEKTLSFKQKDVRIGGVDVLSYYPSEPISQLIPNHAEDTGLTKLEGFEMETYSTKLTLTSPAASEKETQEEQYHYYFVDPKNGKAYDMYFNTAHFHDEKIALQIAKTFKLK